MKTLFFIFIMLIGRLNVSFGQRRTVVHLISKKNFSQQADSVLNIALQLVDSVINTQEFKEGILKAKFARNNNLSNTEILSLFLSGQEVYQKKANDTMDLILETYPDQKGDNIGTTYSSTRIVSSEAYILRNGARCYAAHIIHEYCHTIGVEKTGFQHRHKVLSKKQRKEKCQSVPYVIGDLSRKILGVQTCKCECENYPPQ